MKLTLASLVENINNTLVEKEGTKVSSPLHVCRQVREYIKSEGFYASLKEAGIENLLEFEDDIDKMDKVFLRTSESELRPIIKIEFNISYYSEDNLNMGGILTRLKCHLIGEGKSMATIPVEQVVLALQFNDIKKKKDALQLEIDELEEHLIAKRADRAKMETEMQNLVKKLQELKAQKDEEEN